MTIIAVPTNRPVSVRIKRPSERRSLSRSATRALDVLECFGNEQRRLRAIEIARLLDLQGSTTNQLLKTMVDSAHLVFDARTKTYFPSPRLAGFANLMSEVYGQDDRWRMLVKELHLRTRLSITLTTPNGLFMQILHIEAPPGQNTERGLQIGLFGSAIGSAYIASLPDDRIEDLVCRAGLDPRVLPVLLETAHKVRQDGYADGVGPDKTVWTIAMPIPETGSPLPMVLAVAGERRLVEPRVPELRALMTSSLDHWLGSGSRPIT